MEKKKELSPTPEPKPKKEFSPSKKQLIEIFEKWKWGEISNITLLYAWERIFSESVGVSLCDIGNTEKESYKLVISIASKLGYIHRDKEDSL